MSSPKPFRIDIDQQQIDDLKMRLRNTRWPDKETVDDWSQGAPLAYIQEITEYWLNVYDWRAREAALNRFPQFTLPVNGLDIHFIHLRSPEKHARPLIMSHGWPGSFVEFLKVLSPLTDPVSHGGNAEDAFHIVAPSLPGYGFSAKPASPGWGVEKIADTWSLLMQALGYSKYYAQGGDWGSIITHSIAERDPDHCLGVHVNLPIVPPDPHTMEEMSDTEKSAIAGFEEYEKVDSGYSKQQSTRPQTLSYGLADSPVGQAAWILEKYWKWTDCNGHPENVVTRDELLDNIMMYWLPGTAASSARLYWESFATAFSTSPPRVPLACSIFPKEIFRTSRRWAENHFGDKLAYFNELDRGGHFAAFEQPELFVNEIRKAFAAIKTHRSGR